ncbi:MAG TPA: CHASE2 domain-containing protein [Methylomirabilota bacterium]|jgi:adenylate cyclase|nr:CHASE2 domain-containing protein [Methylomirabilota bacterium]
MKVQWARGREIALKHLAGIVAGLAVVVLVHLGRFETLEHLSLAQLFEARGAFEWSLAQLFGWREAHAPTLPVVIVTIDESSFSELGEQWPFPRAMHGQLLGKIAAGKPLAIGVDVIFDLPSSRGRADDEALGSAVAAAGNVVLGAAVADDDQPSLVSDSERTIGISRTALNPPIEIIRHGAAGVAPVNMLRDLDGHVRRVPLWTAVGDKRIPGLDAELYRLVAKAGIPVAPLPERRSVMINFHGGRKTYPWVPYYRVVTDEIPTEFWKDKIVLIGPTSEILHDQFPTPFAPRGDMPGVEIHANALETLVRGNYIREVPQPISTALAVVAGLLGCALVVRLHAKRALLAAAGLWVVLTLAAFAGFLVSDVWMRGMAGSIALVLGTVLTVGEHFIREQRQRKALGRFFSPDVRSQVVRKGGLSTSRRLVTVLFSDIRGFTSLSERLEPEQVAEMLREYLSEMTEIVFKHGGTVDKYIGDAIMALYNAPLEDPEHAIKAVRTGLEFQERTLAVSKRWEDKLGIPIRNGVGINTGEAVVGTLGSKQRLEYTAIGDTINLGARLESITKEYQANIIISESTYELVKDQFVTKELGDVTVKGKSKPVKIYTVLPHNIRKHPRATLEAAATLSIAGEGRACAVTTLDISEGGMALKGVPDDWQPGQVVQIRCEGGALPKPIVAEATIAWRRGEEVGILFTSLDPDSAPTVADYVSGQIGR